MHYWFNINDRLLNELFLPTGGVASRGSASAACAAGLLSQHTNFHLKKYIYIKKIIKKIVSVDIFYLFQTIYYVNFRETLKEILFLLCNH